MKEELHNPTLRVVKILDLVNDNQEGISLIDISKKLQIPKSTISPILKTLVLTNLLKRDQNGLYTASFKLFQLGLSYSGKLDTLSMIREQMEIVVEKIGEIVQFGVLIGDDVLYLQKVNSPDNIEIVSSVGKKIPAVYTSLGKALLSQYTDDEIKERFKNYEFKSYTQYSIKNVDELIDHIRMVRKKGYAVENQEYTLDTSCIAVPIREKGIIKASMSATYPMFRKKENTEKEISEVLLFQQQIIEDIIKIQNLRLDFTSSRNKEIIK